MSKRHMKRQTAPKTWPIPKKGTKFVTRPLPGKEFKLSIPLSIVFKKMLKYCKTTKEVKRILENQMVVVDGKRRKDHRYSVGLMDVVSIPSLKEYYRLVLNKKGKLDLVSIDAKEANIKPCKIINKSLLPGGVIQINLNDGRNLRVKKDEFKVGDALLIDIDKKEIKEHLKFEEKAYVLLDGGKHIGERGIIKSIKDKLAEIENDEGKALLTDRKHSYLIGKNKPSIKITEK